MSPTRKARIKRKYLKLRPFKRHSLVLMMAGTVYMLIGISYMINSLNAHQSEGLVIALSWAPIKFWGGVWFGVGLLAFISSRWPPVFESWGYMVLTALSAGWSATYLTGVIFEHTSTGNLRAVGAWGLIAFLWWAVSGLLNPDKEAVQTHGTGGDS